MHDRNTSTPSSGKVSPSIGEGSSIELGENPSVDDSATRLTADPEAFDLTDAILGPNRKRKGGNGSADGEDEGLSFEAGLKAWMGSWLNKGDLSNLATFTVLLIGLLVRMLAVEDRHDESWVAVFCSFLVSFGLFGFSGGITNWLAVKMLFDKIGVEPYYLWGSGVIPRQFIAIREAVKNMILKMFFDRTFMQRYLNDRAKGMLEGVDLGAKLKSAMAEPKFDGILEEKLTELSTKPEGMLIATISPMFGGMKGMVPVLKPFLASFGEELLKVIVERFDVDELVSIDTVLREIELLLNEKLKMITPEMVKELLEEVIHEHLGWLVVWGNIFGGAIGLISAIVGLGV